jgi:hypothetical protein
MVTLSKPRSRVPFANVRWFKGINLLKGVIPEFIDIEPIPEDPEKAIDGNIDTYMSECSNVSDKTGRLGWVISPRYIKKIKFKIGVRNQDPDKSIKVVVDIIDKGPIKTIISTSTTEQIFIEEIPVNFISPGVFIWLSPDEPHDKVWIKVYEIALVGK